MNEHVADNHWLFTVLVILWEGSPVQSGPMYAQGDGSSR